MFISDLEPEPRRRSLSLSRSNTVVDVNTPFDPKAPKTICEPWFNTKNWRSLALEILDSKVEKTKKLKLYLTVDSRTVHTDCKANTGVGIRAEWNIRSTSQTVTIHVQSIGMLGSTSLGFIKIPLAFIAPENGSTRWYTVNKAGQGVILTSEMGRDANFNKNPTDDPNQLQIRTTFSTEPARSDDLPEYIAKSSKSSIKKAVSKKKIRFMDDGFDLDLTYITDNVIAMGYPSEGREGIYRNGLKDVQRFFNNRHPEAFRFYNLCSERFYDPAKFDGRVRRFPFDDHNPPPFNVLPQFCENVRQFLEEHPQNVAAIHCKAGKGRTGTVIACYLVYCGYSVDSDHSLKHFGDVRTSNSKGVTIPSQIRYVHYFDKYVKLKRFVPFCSLTHR